MSLRAVEHIFTGSTTPIASYDSTKTNLGTLMIQKSGSNPEDNFVGPLPVAVARPLEESTGVAMMFPHTITFSTTTPSPTTTPVTCSAYCVSLGGYTTGTCRQNSVQCAHNGETYEVGGASSCVGNGSNDSCCCHQ